MPYTDETLRKLWREEVQKWPEMDSLGSADWWLSKFQAYKEYLIACGEGMKKEAPAENDIPFDWGVEFEGDRRERIGYNQALDAFITKIKGE